MTYDEYLKAVDSEMVAMAGVHIADISDYCYRDAWEDDIPPKRCAKLALRADQ